MPNEVTICRFIQFKERLFYLKKYKIYATFQGEKNQSVCKQANSQGSNKKAEEIMDYEQGCSNAQNC